MDRWLWRDSSLVDAKEYLYQQWKFTGWPYFFSLSFYLFLMNFLPHKFLIFVLRHVMIQPYSWMVLPDFPFWCKRIPRTGFVSKKKWSQEADQVEWLQFSSFVPSFVLCLFSVVWSHKFDPAHRWFGVVSFYSFAMQLDQPRKNKLYFETKNCPYWWNFQNNDQ